MKPLIQLILAHFMVLVAVAQPFEGKIVYSVKMISLAIQVSWQTLSEDIFALER